MELLIILTAISEEYQQLRREEPLDKLTNLPREEAIDTVAERTNNVDSILMRRCLMIQQYVDDGIE